MTRPSLRIAGALTLLTFTSSGCSWIFMSKAPEPVVAPNYPVECTSSRAAPVIDSVVAGLYAFSAIGYASIETCDDPTLEENCTEPEVKTAGVATSAVLAAVLLASAMSGFRKATRCGQVKSLNALCITGDLAACQALRPGFVPAVPPGADPWGTKPPDRWGPPQPAPGVPQQSPPPQGPPAGTQ